MNELMKTQLSLAMLTVYRKVLADDTAAKFQRLLEAACGCDLRSFLNSYGEFYGSLAASGTTDFSAYLRRRVRYDDNVFSRLAAAGETDSAVFDAAKRDLAALRRALTLTCTQIREAARANFAQDDEEAAAFIDALPAFYSREQGYPSDGAAFDGLLQFYRENGCGEFARYRAFKWQKNRKQEAHLYGVERPDAVALSMLKGYDYERGVVLDNTRDFVEGYSANNMLLYGDRGTGKSSTVKAVFNAFQDKGLRIVELSKDCIVEFPHLMQRIGALPLKFILFIDDLSFLADDDNYSALKAVLEGGIAARPKNTVIYATSNRRHFVKESFAEREDVHAGDAMQEKLSLADRFGITVTFSSPDQQLYFEIVAQLVHDRGIEVERTQLERGAAQWALRFNGRSPRAAGQFVDWVEGRVARGLSVTDF